MYYFRLFTFESTYLARVNTDINCRTLRKTLLSSLLIDRLLMIGVHLDCPIWTTGRLEFLLI